MEIAKPCSNTDARPWLSRALVAVLAVPLAFASSAGCALPSTDVAQETVAEVEAAAEALPRVGGESTLDVGSWNVEWFGSPTNGPEDDELQQTRAADVLRASGVDVWGLQEIVDERSFRALEAETGYRGILASDGIVRDGRAFYGRGEQKLAALYDAHVLTLDDARVVLTEYDADFAGRPPLALRFRYEAPDGASVPVTVVVVHLKAGGERRSYDKRLRSAGHVKRWLDAFASDEAVFVIGDFNDGIESSRLRGYASPFVDLDETYFFPTYVFERRGEATMVFGGVPFDHHLAAGAARRGYVEGSAQVLRPDAVLDAYGETTSDHYPVVTRWRL